MDTNSKISMFITTIFRLIAALFLAHMFIFNQAVAQIPSTTSTASKSLYILSVGIDNYPAPFNLASCEADARYFASKINKNGKYRSIDSKLLINESASRESILKGLEWMVSRVGVNDVGVIYIAGQGDSIDSQYAFIPSGNGSLPEKGEVNNDTEYRDWKKAYAKSRWITASDIIKSANSIRGTLIVVVDTNYSSWLLNNSRRLIEPASVNRIVFSATSGKELAQEDMSTNIGGGYFTRTLLKYLSDNSIPIESINSDSAQRISRLVFEQTNSTQRPLMLSNGKLFGLEGLNAEKELDDLELSFSTEQNKIVLEKSIVAKNGTCKILIPIGVIRDSTPDMLADASLYKCRGGNWAISAAIESPSMKWSGNCDSDGYAYGESGELSASYPFQIERRIHGTHNYVPEMWSGNTVITGGVKKGHFQGKISWRIRAHLPGDGFLYSCSTSSKDNIYVSKGLRFGSQQDYDEFLNPELKKARLALEKKNRDEAENRQRAYEEEQRKRGKEFVASLNSKDPQAMYLAAGKYAREGDSDKAKQIYEAITNRFSSSPFAIKASDQLTAMDRLSRAQSATEQADSNARQRAYNACKVEVNSCYSRTNGKGNCYRDCDSLR